MVSLRGRPRFRLGKVGVSIIVEVDDWVVVGSPVIVSDSIPPLTPSLPISFSSLLRPSFELSLLALALRVWFVTAMSLSCRAPVFVFEPLGLPRLDLGNSG